MSTLRILAFFALGALLISSRSSSQETAKEPSTGKSFPTVTQARHDGTDYLLGLTGLTVRKKFFFKVYGMAHYMQDPVRSGKSEAFAAIMSDGKAKQITMEFARDVDAAKIKEAYQDGFKEHATKDELKNIDPLINRFIAYFSKDVKENDTYILRWFPGGTIVAVIQGEEEPAITDVTFARTLWSIWFGESSIVDRDDLVARMVAP